MHHATVPHLTPSHLTPPHPTPPHPTPPHPTPTQTANPASRRTAEHHHRTAAHCTDGTALHDITAPTPHPKDGTSTAGKAADKIRPHQTPQHHIVLQPLCGATQLPYCTTSRHVKIQYHIHVHSTIGTIVLLVLYIGLSIYKLYHFARPQRTAQNLHCTELNQYMPCPCFASTPEA